MNNLPNTKTNPELSTGYAIGQSPVKETNEQSGRPSLVVVDTLADELANEYGNSQFHAWYCGVIYKYGVSRVMQWRQRAAKGKDPARLFSAYVKEAGKQRDLASLRKELL